MKKLILTAVLLGGLSASVLAQGTISVDNLNGSGTSSSTSNGLFYGSSGAVYNGASINAVLLGGASAASLTPVASFTGAGALFGFGGGVFADPMGLTYAVNGVALGGTATLQLQAWIGTANSYGQAGAPNQFRAWNGSAYVAADTFTFTNPTGGAGVPPGLPKSLDGMPAMRLVTIPEPSTMALAGLGIASLLIFRRRK